MKIKISDAVTGLALIVSGISAAFSYYSMRYSGEQARLADLQIRPYVRVLPAFIHNTGDLLIIKLISENLSVIPARVIYDQTKPWVDGHTTGLYLFNKTGDVLYEHHNGSSEIPVPSHIARLAENGKINLMIGSCILYSPIPSSDNRRWEFRVLYQYSPHQEKPLLQYFIEREVSSHQSTCDASALYSEWTKVRQ